MTAQKFTIHTKMNNEDVVLHPKTEMSQVEGLATALTSITDAEIQAHFTDLDPSTTQPEYITLSQMQTYVAAEIAKLPLADNNDYPISDNIEY